MRIYPITKEYDYVKINQNLSKVKTTFQSTRLMDIIDSFEIISNESITPIAVLDQYQLNDDKLKYPLWNISINVKDVIIREIYNLINQPTIDGVDTFKYIEDNIYSRYRIKEILFYVNYLTVTDITNTNYTLYNPQYTTTNNGIFTIDNITQERVGDILTIKYKQKQLATENTFLYYFTLSIEKI